VKFQPLQVPDRRNAERVFIETGYPIAFQPNGVDERAFDQVFVRIESKMRNAFQGAGFLPAFFI